MEKINLALFLRVGFVLIALELFLTGSVNADLNTTDDNNENSPVIPKSADYKSQRLSQLLNKWWTKASTSHIDYVEMSAMLLEIKTEFHDIVYLYSIGKTVENREMWAVKMGTYVDRPRELMKPMMKHVANMHGNEVTGRALILMFIIDLLKEYTAYQRDKSANPRETPNEFTARAMTILESIELHLLPSANPDGFEVAKTIRSCGRSEADVAARGGLGRRNKNDVDMNRDFPDGFRTVDKNDYQEVFSSHRQPETLHLMKWIVTRPFVLSTNLHDGAVVANYPYDSVPRAIGDISSYDQSGIVSLAPDNDLLRELSFEYSSNHATMSDASHTENTCGIFKAFPNGITNGAHWYNVKGGMQDFNYEWSNCIEITVEISCCKFPNASQLLTEWESNKKSLYAFTETVLSWGVKGIVMDEGRFPVHGASVVVEGNDKRVLTTRRGEYWRMLKFSGEYTLFAEFKGCDSKRQKIVMNITENPRMQIVNFTLPRCPALELNASQSTVLGQNLITALLITIFVISSKSVFFGELFTLSL